jgi:hypothetical protein
MPDDFDILFIQTRLDTIEKSLALLLRLEDMRDHDAAFEPLLKAAIRELDAARGQP